MIEKIHIAWAYSEDAEQKAAENQFYFQNLREQFHIARSTDYMYRNADIIIVPILTQPDIRTYQIVKNKPKLSYDELALIADTGSLCFGYRRDGDKLIIYTN